MMNRTLALGAAMIISSIALAPAVTAAPDTETVRVEHADLDLSTAEGRDTLDRRIDRAARTVCGYGEQQMGTRIRSRDARECYRQARRGIDRQLAAIVDEAQRGG